MSCWNISALLSSKMVESIVNNKLLVGGYVYLKWRIVRGKIYWDCCLLPRKVCMAYAITALGPRQILTVLKGSQESPHEHPPNHEECRAKEVWEWIKRKAFEHPKQLPAQLLRTEKEDLAGYRSTEPVTQEGEFAYLKTTGYNITL